MTFHSRDLRPGSQRPMIGIRAALHHDSGRPPVGIWTFGEGSGNTALDLGPLGNHGALIGAPRRTAANDGPALALDGITQYVSVAHSPALMPKQITIAVRARNRVTPAQFDVILSKCTDSSWGDGYGIFYDGGSVVKFFVGHYSTGGVAQASLTPTADSILVGTYDGAFSRLFVNGLEGTPASYSGGITANTAPLELGRGRSDSYNIDGLLGWVQIFDYALPPEEARLLSAGVNPWRGWNPLGPLRIRSSPYGTALNITTTSSSGDGITRIGVGDGVARGGGKA